MQNNYSLVNNLISFIFVGLPQAIIYWQLFKKAGRPGWAGIIPIYNTFVMAQIAKRTKLWVVSFIGYAIAVPSFIIFTSKVTQHQGAPQVDSSAIILIAVAAISMVVAGILYLFILISFLKKYQASTLFWFGYLFLPIVAVFFANRAVYKGDDGNAAGVNPLFPQTAPSAPLNPVTNPMPPQAYVPGGPMEAQPQYAPPTIIAPQPAMSSQQPVVLPTQPVPPVQQIVTPEPPETVPAQQPPSAPPQA